MKVIAAAAGLAIALSTVGCGQSRTVPVKGQIVWEDGTLAGDLVGYMVESAVPGSNVSSRGDVEAEGRFILSTFVQGDGAEPGAHKVSIYQIPRNPGEEGPKGHLPARYNRRETSGLAFTAERGKINDVKLTVTRK